MRDCATKRKRRRHFAQEQGWRRRGLCPSNASSVRRGQTLLGGRVREVEGAVAARTDASTHAPSYRVGVGFEYTLLLLRVLFLVLDLRVAEGRKDWAST